MKISKTALARWLYRALLYLYPPQFRREFGAQMGQDFAQMYRLHRCSGRRPTWGQRLAFWGMMGKDIAGSLWREYRALLPSPRGWWWLRLVALIGVGVGVFQLTTLVETTTDLWLLPDDFSREWWLLGIPLWMFGDVLPLIFGLWALPTSRRMKYLVRGLSLLLGLSKFTPKVLWLTIFKRPDSIDRLINGTWEPWVYFALTSGMGLAAILILSCITLRKPAYRWWSIAMVLIYVAPWLTSKIAWSGGFIPIGGGDAFFDALRILDITRVLGALGWIFFGVKLWMRVPRQARHGQLTVAG